MAYPYLDLDFQQRTFRALITGLHADPLAGIDVRIRGRDLRATKFIICGSHLPIEIKWIMGMVEVVAFVDDFRTNMQIRERPVITTEAWLEMSPDIVPIIVVEGLPGFDHFTRLCTCLDRPYLTMLQFERLVRTQFTPPRLAQNFNAQYFDAVVEASDRFERACALFEEPFSRTSFYSILNYKLTRDPAFLAAVAPAALPASRLQTTDYTDGVAFGHFSYQLDRRFVRFGADDVMVDGGAFDGASAYHMARAARGAFRRIDVYEPDLAFLAKCEQAVALVAARYGAAAAAKMKLIGKGLWSSTTTLDFLDDFHDSTEFRDPYGSPMGAHLVDAAPTAEDRGMAKQVPVTTIDETSPDATFIKLEIEGAELAALHGGRATIERNRPAMSIAVYHLPADMYELPEFVAELKLGYKLGFRHHNRLNITSTNIYATIE